MPFAVELSGFFALFVLLIGAWGILAPSRILDFANRFGTSGGLWVASAIRVVFGLALWFAAPASRAPLLLQVLGAITVLAGVMLPFLGVDRFKALIDWGTKLSPNKLRAWCLLALALGGTLLWALLPAAG